MSGDHASEAPLAALWREPAGEPAGALVLLHGRGADERDLFPLLDELDPQRRLLGVTPRGPLALPPGGAHWYAFQDWVKASPRGLTFISRLPIMVGSIP